MLFLAADEGGTAAAVGGPEVNGVHIPVVVHIDDGAAVTGDGLLLEGLNSEAIVRLGSGCCQVTGSAGLGFGFLKGELIIVHILLPVNHCVLGIGVALPLGGEGDALSQFAAEGESGIPIVPAQEGIALTGGLGGFHGIGAGRHEGGGGIAAAVGIIGDPVASLYLGVQGHIGAVQDDGIHPVGQSGLSIPAGDGLIGVHGEGNIGGNLRAVGSLLGGTDCRNFRIVHEEHVVHKLKLRIIVQYGGSGDGSGSGGEEAAVLPALPAGELVAVLLGRGGRVDLASVGHILGVLQFTVHIEVIGGNRGRGVLNVVGVHALHGAVENLHVVGIVSLGTGEGGSVVATAVAQEGLVVHDLHIALHSGDGEGEVLGLLLGGEGHGVLGEGGFHNAAQVGEGHVDGTLHGALGQGLGLLGLGLLGLHRGVVHVDGAGGIGVGAGENRLVLAVLPLVHGGFEGVALHSGDIRHEGLFRLLRTEHQLLGGEGMALLAVGVDSTKHHSQLHAGLRFCGFCGLRRGRVLRRIGGSLRALRRIGGSRRALCGIGGSLRGLRGIGPGGFPGLGRGFYSQGLRGGAALRGLGRAGFGGFLHTAPPAAAGQQPPGGIQDAGGQDDGNCHNQGQDTGM